MDEGAAASAQSRAPVGRLAFLALAVALCAAVASGSCAGCVNWYEIEEGRKSLAGSVLFPALLSASLALAIGLMYLRPSRPWPEAKLFATISVTAYVAGMLGAWWPLFAPAGVAIIVIIVGGVAAREITWRDNTDSPGRLLLYPA